MINLPIDKQYKVGFTRPASQRGAREFSTARTRGNSGYKAPRCPATKKLSRHTSEFLYSRLRGDVNRHVETKAGVKRDNQLPLWLKQALWTAAAEHMMCITEEDLDRARKHFANSLNRVALPCTC